MNKTLNALLNLDKNTKIRDICDFAFHRGADRIFLNNLLPGIRLKLFDSQGKPLIFTVNLENNGLNHLILGIFLGRMFDSLGPGKIGHMDQTVYTFLDTDKNTEIGNILNLTFNNGANRIIIHNQIPGIGLQLLHAERNPFGININI